MKVGQSVMAVGNPLGELGGTVTGGMISLILDVSPNCDCHPENDAAILPNIGMFASFDPVALDQACADACLKANGSRQATMHG